MVLKAVKDLERLAVGYVTILITSTILQAYLYYLLDSILCVFSCFTMSQNCFQLYATIL